MNLQILLQNFADANNIIAGVCHPGPLDTTRLLQSEFTPFVSADILKRVSPALSLKSVKSIIAIGVPYKKLESLKPDYSLTTNTHTGNLSSLGTNEDYHVLVKDALIKLKAQLPATTKTKILVDSGGLDERGFAHRAGLGFFGKNGLLISKKFGSLFNIGLMLTDIMLEEDSYQSLVETSCPAKCNLCIEACPTNALTLQGLNVKNCISYLTQKENLSQEEEELLKATSNQLYGCDICQNICLLNKKVALPLFTDSSETPEPKVTAGKCNSIFLTDKAQTNFSIDLNKWLNMDTEDFNKTYKNTAMLWKGTDILKRNGKLISSNNNKPC